MEYGKCCKCNQMKQCFKQTSGKLLCRDCCVIIAKEELAKLKDRK